jgi:hypothetical protein
MAYVLGSSPGDLLVALSSTASEVALVMFETSEGIAKGNWFIKGSERLNRDHVVCIGRI